MRLARVMSRSAWCRYDTRPARSEHRSLPGVCTAKVDTAPFKAEAFAGRSRLAAVPRISLEKLCQFTVLCGVNRVFCVNKINNLAPEKTGCESCRSTSFNASHRSDF